MISEAKGVWNGREMPHLVIVRMAHIMDRPSW